MPKFCNPPHLLLLALLSSASEHDYGPPSMRFQDMMEDIDDVLGGGEGSDAAGGSMSVQAHEEVHEWKIRLENNKGLRETQTQISTVAETMESVLKRGLTFQGRSATNVNMEYFQQQDIEELSDSVIQQKDEMIKDYLKLHPNFKKEHKRLNDKQILATTCDRIAAIKELVEFNARLAAMLEMQAEVCYIPYELFALDKTQELFYEISIYDDELLKSRLRPHFEKELPIENFEHLKVAFAYYKLDLSICKDSLKELKVDSSAVSNLTGCKQFLQAIKTSRDLKSAALARSLTHCTATLQSIRAIERDFPVGKYECDLPAISDQDQMNAAAASLKQQLSLITMKKAEYILEYRSAAGIAEEIGVKMRDRFTDLEELARFKEQLLEAKKKGAYIHKLNAKLHPR